MPLGERPFGSVSLCKGLRCRRCCVRDERNMGGMQLKMQAHFWFCFGAEKDISRQ